MSHPYTDAYGYPLTAVQALRRMRSKRPLHTGAVMSATFGQRPKTVHQAAEAANDNEVKADRDGFHETGMTQHP